MRKLDTAADPKGNFIGGAWTPPSTGTYEPNTNPADQNDIIGHYARSGAADANAAVSSAQAAFPAWAETPAPERGRVLARAAALIRSRIDTFATMLCREEGKTVVESRGEILKGIALLEWYSGEGFRLGGKVVPSEMRKTLTFTTRHPVGVVALITPWNFPFAIPVWKSAPALVAGCTVVMKPASLTPGTAALLCEAYAEAGLPKGVMNLVTGPGGAVGNTLVDHPGVRAISFTGSNEIGMALAQRAAKRGVRVTCEMGGKNPVVVMDDADLDLAASGILGGAFGSTGQRCTATSRVVVQAGVHDALIERLAAGAKKLKVGNGQQAGIDMGPAVDAGQLKTDTDYIKIAQDEGAKLVAGGKRLQDGDLARGFYVEPTVFSGVTAKMRIAQEEVFGPVLSVLKAENFDEAVKLANDVEFGLASSIYTRDANVAMRFVEQSEVGMVHVNNPTVGGEAQLPFGGIKSTGLGSREMSEEGAEFFTEQKTVFWDYTGAPRTSKIY
ncbi:MAG: aldehyde dehydrogenase family protein [Deltaproteobacteria bacterium]|nr:aldehyde dehydrogenase family protein [Deltaproteobacteria bacterium]